MIPKKLRIHGKNFSCQAVKIESVLHSENCGRVKVSDLEIFYNGHHNPQQQVDTVLHEVIHVIDYDAQLGLTERQVHSLASHLVAFLSDNPKFVTAFQKAYGQEV